ncbi:hypothetical protein [Zunongwangia sp. HGR-M22]|uniref:hypothetical protein n=1 Tax=Zunongwangia sp. HGR-M22 TaxID=3015168 RepID=UPI0022DCEDB1|nr:hypothetical protein [Zunongwangia sp. HGR-M22]WBL25032.1 hypothetical protein PBT91_14155 [Zunongwangia sp. HGR-M22]
MTNLTRIKGSINNKSSKHFLTILSVQYNLEQKLSLRKKNFVELLTFEDIPGNRK